MNITNKDLKRRIIEISYKYQQSHLGSCLTAVDIINDIYQTKKPNEKFVLSSGHAAMALYAVIEKYEGVNAETAYLHHGVHPDRCQECHIYCSSGSLGHGLPIAVGMALAERTKNIYCLISDGELSEGSIHEAMNVAEDYQINNLKISVNYNGWGAYHKIPQWVLPEGRTLRENARIYFTNVEQLPFLKGQDAHYYKMNEADYKLAIDYLNGL